MKENVHISDLSPKIQRLLEQAKNASESAYAPYSNFFVGSVILTESGESFLGANQENAAYPSCMCGERVALYNYIMNSSSSITELAIYAENRQKDEKYCAAPCGACRQVILEFQHRQESNFTIYSVNQFGYVKEWKSIYELLPNGFDGRSLLP